MNYPSRPRYINHHSLVVYMLLFTYPTSYSYSDMPFSQIYQGSEGDELDSYNQIIIGMTSDGIAPEYAKFN